MSLGSLARSLRPSLHYHYLPVFLAPALVPLQSPPERHRQFTTSSTLCERKVREKPKKIRKTRDMNKERGVSALRRTGLKYPVSMSKEPLPQPVLDPEKRSKVEVNQDHGLWGFFNEKRQALSTPIEDIAFGRLTRRAGG